MPIHPSFVAAGACPAKGLGRHGLATALLAALLLAAGPAAAEPKRSEPQAAPLQLADIGGRIERLVAQMERKSAFFRILFEDHPGERLKFIEELKAAYRFGGGDAMRVAAIGFGAHIGWKYAAYYFSRTSEHAMLAYARLLSDTLTLLRLGSHDDCYAFIAGGSVERARAYKVLNREERRRMVRVMTALVVESRRAKRPRKADPNAYRRPLHAVLLRVAAKLGRENLVEWKPGLVGDDRVKACNFAIAFFDEVLKRPAPEAALVLRAVLAD